MDYSMNLEQSGIVKNVIQQESNLPYYEVKKSTGDSIIEHIYPLGNDLLALKTEGIFWYS